MSERNFPQKNKKEVSHMHKVKVFNNNGNIIPTHVEIDGKPLRCRSIDYHADHESFPMFVFEVSALSDIEVNHADIRFKFHPYTVVEAVKILRHELIQHGDVYCGFLASIKSALNDMCDGASDTNRAAEKILERMIGDNDK